MQVIQDQQGAGRAGHRAQQPPGRRDQQPPLLLRLDFPGRLGLAGAGPAGQCELGQQQIHPACLPQRLRALTGRQPLQRIVQRAGQRSVGILGPPQAAAPCDAPPAARATRGSLLQQPGLAHAWLADQQQHGWPGPGEELADLRHLGVPAGQQPGGQLAPALAAFACGSQRGPVLVGQAQHGSQPVGGGSRQLPLILL